MSRRPITASIATTCSGRNSSHPKTSNALFRRRSADAVVIMVPLCSGLWPVTRIGALGCRPGTPVTAE
ncbi:hypothetical protein HEK131_37810 [Streptomyces seoulensis]|nr:hypothetical protein HEK131_37810 [Streptomyces seoulensis]